MRFVSLLSLTVTASALAVGACAPPAADNATAPAATAIASADPAAPPVGESVLCAQGDVPMTDDCTIERGADGIMTIRHPDGAFRRLAADGTAADGAETAIVTSADGAREIAVGGDRYRLPEPRR